ncbi:MAG: prepilin-type N-terminal cleavage/methylation domain-containing protein [bacterium]
MRKNAFTLIELLIVVGIIGVLAVIAVPNFLRAQVRARLVQVQANMKSLSTAIVSYQADTGWYPPHDPEHGYNCPAVTTPVSYIASVPVDVFQNDSLTSYEDRLTGNNLQEKLPEIHPEPYYMVPDGAWGVKILDSEIPMAKSQWDLTIRFIQSPFLYGKAQGTYPEGRYLVSIGPDRQVTGNGVYDVSNGLTSSGDVFYVTP